MRTAQELAAVHLADWTLAELAARLLWLAGRRRGVPALWYDNAKRAAWDADVDELRRAVDVRRQFQLN
jgi:hypothetical protein